MYVLGVRHVICSNRRTSPTVVVKERDMLTSGATDASAWGGNVVALRHCAQTTKQTKVDNPNIRGCQQDWGFELRPIEMLKAAMHIKPTRLDVIGFATRDGDLFGAVEFVEMLEDSVCVAHVVALSRNDRRLRIGDDLWCRYAGRIGDTPILAERHIFEVLDLGESDIPALEIPIVI
jgi:hypothetical protein